MPCFSERFVALYAYNRHESEGDKNFLKKRKRKQALSLDNVDHGIERDPAYVELSSRESPVRDVNIGELQEKLNKALQTLSEKHRSTSKARPWWPGRRLTMRNSAAPT